MVAQLSKVRRVSSTRGTASRGSPGQLWMRVTDDSRQWFFLCLINSNSTLSLLLTPWAVGGY